MTLLSRLLAACASLRRPAHLLTSVALCTAGLLVASVPAGAVVTGVGGQVYGLTPRSVELFEGEPETFANPAGNPVVRANTTYAIYWDPTDHYHGDWQQLIDGFFQKMSVASGSYTSIFSVNAQYSDRSNQYGVYSNAFHGAYTDTAPYPVEGNCTDPHPLLPGDAITCLTDSQVRGELVNFIAQHSLPKGMGSIFYMLTPPGVTVCLESAGARCSSSPALPAIDANSFCSYHSAFSPTNPVSGDANTVLYGVIPWSAGGEGDYHLRQQLQAYACQDGGFDPSSKPIEKKEKAKERNAIELEQFEKESPEEQAKTEKTRALEGPHNEEPNQMGLGPDGSWDTGLADLIVGQIATVQQNIVTDPLLNGWQDATGREAADECRNWFAPSLGGTSTANEETEAGTLYNQSLGGANYYLNDAFNLAALKLPYPAVPCVSGIRLIPSFTAPTDVNSGDIVGFNGMESDITLNAGTAYTPAGTPTPAYPTYTWDFGDGSATVTGFAPGAAAANSPAAAPCQAPWETPCAAATFHSYTYGGIYKVTLTVKDVAGNVQSVEHEVNVTGPPPPVAPNGPGGGTPNGSLPPGSSPGSSPGSTIGPFIPGPVARAAAVGTSLKQALRRGLVIGYSVNEQVAGHFEVLLESATAKRLGIKGQKAVGLPTGSPPSVIIGQAILVTTKGGHSTVRIKFSKRTNEHLRRVRKVNLLLRLVVRNSATQHPQITTVLSPVTLHR